MAKNTSGLLPPWPPGTSGNPGGRPKKRPITDEYFNMSEKPLPEKLRKKLEKKWGIDVPKGTTYTQANAIRRYLDSLLEGGHNSSKEMREAMEGKAPQRLEISTAPKTEITLRVSFDKTK